MKKTLLLLASAVLLLVGCQKEQIAEKNVGGEGLQTVSFTVGVESAVTKAVADNDGKAAKINHWVIQVIDSDNAVYHYKAEDGVVGEKTHTFDVPLIKGQTYDVLFWADTKGKYVVTDLCNVKRTDGLKANSDSLDAFSAVVEDFSTAIATQKQVTLKRPFAQLNVVFTDLKKLYETMGSDAEYAKFKPVDFVVKAKVPTTFNVLTQKAGAPAETALEMTAATNYKDNYAAHGEKATLYMDYIFASTTKDIVDIDFSFVSKGVTIAHNFAAVPFQRNYRTNILGDLMSANAKWTVTVDPDWDSQSDVSKDYNVYYYEPSSITDAQEYIENNDDQKAKTVDLSKYTVTTDDFDTTPDAEDKTIKFELKTTSPADMVNFTLPAIPADVISAGCTGWKITHETGYPTQNVNVTAPTGTLVTIDAPRSHVTLNGSVYNQVTATTGPSTLVVPAGVTVKNLTVKEGGVEIHGCVEIVSVTGTAETVFVRECENLTQTVYDGLKNYIAPNYTGVQNTDGSWNIELEDFWPNFAAAEFSAIDQSGKTLTISTPAELALLAKNINAGTSYAGYTISISGNLDMSAHYWIPINAYNGYLSGATINGAGNAVISNLKIENCVNNNTSGYNYYSGFIGQIVGKLTFKDLTFSGADVKVDNGSGIAVVLGLTYSDVLFDNVKVMNSIVSSNTKVGALLGFTGGDGEKATVKNCTLENVTVKAAYSYALMVGLINVRDQVVFEGNNVVDNNTHAVYDEVVGHDEENIEETKEIKGYTYGIEGSKLWVIGVKDAWTEVRTSPTPRKTIDNVEYSVYGDIFYHADGVVVDVCAPDPVAQIGDTKYATLDAAFAAVQAGQTIEIIQAGSYAIPSPINNITVKGADNLVTVADNWGTHPTVVFDASKSSGQLSSLNGVVFSNIKFLFSGNGYTGFQHQAGIVTFNNCDFEGLFNGYGNMVFNDCYFKSTTNEYVMWTYGAPSLAFNGCGFDVAGKALNVYQENSNYDHIITVTNCKFVSSTANKPALAIKNNGNGGSGTSPIYYDITITNSTFDGFGQSDGDLIGFPTDSPYVNAYGYNGATQPLKVTVDGEIRVNISK